MSDLLERLRGRGWRLTSQRRVVAEVLDGEHVHLTADEVHARAAGRLPEISRASVYNTLGELVALGEVAELSAHGRAKRYDPNAHHPHQHLVCSGCGLIRDVHPTGDPLAGLPAQERFGFAVPRTPWCGRNSTYPTPSPTSPSTPGCSGGGTP
ncbi:Fur family transcriptional regulator, partial [Streptomyces erythrochromogenes]|uniref:Fur family transcriptional regulator n=1 Tax=Streptomyces erythrochromogenes TaxID=285574 RepID=UPI003F4DF19A